MDILLVGTPSLLLVAFGEQLAFCDVQCYSTPVENISGHRDHRSGDHDPLITIIPESRSRSLGIRKIGPVSQYWKISPQFPPKNS
jgi:hypothetical protein